MAGNYIALLEWSGEIDSEGHRTYKAISKVVTDDVFDGPEVVMHTPGLPTVGSYWNPGYDVDLWAYCYPNMKIKVQHKKPGERSTHWTVEQIFSTKPINRCQDQSIENPLLEPQKVSGSFVKYNREARFDRFGEAIQSSSFEFFKGKDVEIDANRPTVIIEQNVGILGLPTFTNMIDTVNGLWLWGLPPRTIKLSGVSWERKIFGTCGYYYTRRLEFDIRYSLDQPNFDLIILDRGTRVFDENNPGKDVNNPADYVLNRDVNFNPISTPIALNGQGVQVSTNIPGRENYYYHHKQPYASSNFLLLGIPTYF